LKLFKHHEHEIKYKVYGEVGPVILLLHGFGGGPQDWAEVIISLSGRFRLIVPNIKTFFSSAQPMTYHQQVTLLALFIQEQLKIKNVSRLSLVGQSYGATLTFGLAHLLRKQNSSSVIDKHVVLNPMPFHPFEKLRDKYLQVLVNVSSAPGMIVSFLKSSMGKQSLEEAAKIFRIGGDQHFNERKLRLVHKAIERFVWIDQNEDWAKWHTNISRQPIENLILFHSSADPLFNISDYKELAAQLNAKECISVDHSGHLLLQDCAKKLLELWPFR